MVLTRVGVRVRVGGGGVDEGVVVVGVDEGMVVVALERWLSW